MPSSGSITQTYSLSALTDDGVRVWLDGSLVIDAWQNLVGAEVSAEVALVAGHAYDLRVEYFQNSGNASVELRWSSPSIPLQPIPQRVLYSTTVTGAPGVDGGVTVSGGADGGTGPGVAINGLQATYFDSTSLSGTSISRVDPTINFNWSGTSPDPRIPEYGFSARWM